MTKIEYDNYKNFITVVIPVYNGEKYIATTIESLKNQTYRNFEVLIIDDCSQDNSIQIIKNHISEDQRFKLIEKKENAGNAVKNVEYALQFCKGEWFFYMSHDDLIAPDFFEKSIKKSTKTGADCVIPNMLYYYNDLQPEEMDGTFPPNRNYETVLSNIEAFKLSIYWKIHAFHLKKMSIVKKLPWNSHLMAGDEILNRLYFYYSNKIVFVDTNFYYNQENDEAITKAIKPRLLEYVECYLKLVEFMYAHKNNFDKKTINECFGYTVKLLKSYRNIFENNYSLLTTEQKKQIDRYYKELKIKLLTTSFKIKNFNNIFRILRYSHIRKLRLKKIDKNKYIVICANIPNENNEKDGMIQRELAIDLLMKNQKRVYIDKVCDLKFLKYPKRWLKSAFNIQNNIVVHKQLKNSKVKIYHSIPQIFLYKLLKNAEYIYVHSLLKLEEIPKEYIAEFKDKIILDIHGCVVEEFKYDNAPEYLINKFEHLEEYFKEIKYLVTVSENMFKFYKHKYPKIKTKFITLPIYTTSKIKPIKKNYNNKLNIVYSGGVHKWQNVDLMIESISKIIDKYNVTILTPAIDTFKDKLKQYNLENKITIKTVSAKEIHKEYEKIHFGYVLRDDIIVNKVACPTKLVEYLSYGIIPIVLQPSIGDFNNLGYSYILNEDLINEKIPSAETLKEMSQNNYRVIEKLDKIQKHGKETLLKIL